MYLVCVEPLRFSDGVLKAGTRVERLQPTNAEVNGRGEFVGGLKEDQERDIDKREPREWIVVLWNGARRRVPLRAFRRE